MILDYDIIFGLNYYSCEEEPFEILHLNIEPTPIPIEDLLEEWRLLIQRMGIQLVNTFDSEQDTEIWHPIISNVPYFE